MHVVIFEVRPNKGRYDEYLDIATALRSELAKIDGFISIERFTSLSEEGKILSLSFWRDEEAITAWREQPEHRHAQRKGRHELFEATLLMGRKKDIRQMVVYGYARLVGYDTNFNLVPDVLKSVEEIEGRIFTFHCARAIAGPTASPLRPKISAITSKNRRPARRSRMCPCPPICWSTESPRNSK